MQPAAGAACRIPSRPKPHGRCPANLATTRTGLFCYPRVLNGGISAEAEAVESRDLELFSLSTASKTDTQTLSDVVLGFSNQEST
jgi:hypothetical protein